MPKLLLLQPPIQDFYDTEIRLQPIGLCYLKAAVRKFAPDWEVKILDFHHGRGRRTIPVPAELNYLKPYYAYHDRSPFCGFHQYYHFGAGFEQIARQVAGEKPDLVGISSLFSPYYREVLRTAQEIKALLSVPILVGGSHVSAVPESILQHPAVDFIIRGEGEKALVEFLQACRLSRNWSGVPNLGFKDHGRMVLNPVEANYPLEQIPAPDLSDFSPGDYPYDGKPMSFLVTSRSCPHRCSFCSVHATFGLTYRRTSVDQVMEEVLRRYEQGYRVIDFEDDNLTFYQEEMKELCRRIIRRFPRKDLQLLAMNGISYLSLDSELLTLMKEAGFTHLNLALVSSDTTVREATKRPHTVKKYLEVVAQAVDLGMKVVSYQILGLPGEKLSSMTQTLCFAARLPVLLGASPFYLTPNSPIALKLGRAAEPTDIFRSRLTAMAWESEDFRREDLYTLFLTTRIIDFLKAIPLKPSEIALEELFEASLLAQFPERTRNGLQILARLLHSGSLLADTPQGLQPLRRFAYPVFEQVWSQLNWIGTQGAKRIRIAGKAMAGLGVLQ